MKATPPWRNTKHSAKNKKRSLVGSEQNSTLSELERRRLPKIDSTLKEELIIENGRDQLWKRYAFSPSLAVLEII
jgi:hypothetical protein